MAYDAINYAFAEGFFFIIMLTMTLRLTDTGSFCCHYTLHLIRSQNRPTPQLRLAVKIFLACLRTVTLLDRVPQTARPSLGNRVSYLL